MNNSIKLHVLHTGEVYIDKALAFREFSLHPMPYTGWFRTKKNKRWVPVSAYLIQHPKGNVLVDTGWHTDIRHKQRKHLGLIPYTMFKGRLPQGESIHEQLYALGIRTQDLDYVVLSHMHADHVSGVKHVKDAKKIMVSQVEWKAAQKELGYVPSMWKGVSIETFEFESIPYGPYQKGIDLFKDKSIYLVYTPGHSKGQISVLIRQGEGWVLLVSDVGYAEKSWKDIILPGVTTNDEQAKKSLEWVNHFSLLNNCYDTIANHDPSVKKGLWRR